MAFPDLIAVVIALAAFAAILATVELLERVWAPPTPCSSRSRSCSSSISRTRCCAGSGC